MPNPNIPHPTNKPSRISLVLPVVATGVVLGAEFLGSILNPNLYPPGVGFIYENSEVINVMLGLTVGANFFNYFYESKYGVNRPVQANASNKQDDEDADELLRKPPAIRHRAHESKSTLKETQRKDPVLRDLDAKENRQRATRASKH